MMPSTDLSHCVSFVLRLRSIRTNTMAGLQVIDIHHQSRIRKGNQVANSAPTGLSSSRTLQKLNCNERGSHLSAAYAALIPFIASSDLTRSPCTSNASLHIPTTSGRHHEPRLPRHAVSRARHHQQDRLQPRYRPRHRRQSHRRRASRHSRGSRRQRLPPGGAGALGNILSKVDPGILGNLGNLIGGAGQQQLVDSGSNALSSLLGGSSTNAIAGAIGKFAGIDCCQERLAPRHAGARRPRHAGKAAERSRPRCRWRRQPARQQKTNIAAAMPAGLSDLLKGSGVLDSIAGNLKVGGTGVARRHRLRRVCRAGCCRSSSALPASISFRATAATART